MQAATEQRWEEAEEIYQRGTAFLPEVLSKLSKGPKTAINA